MVEGGFCSGANRQTAHKNPDNRANHDNLPASFACLRCEGALHVENLRESGERWRQKGPMPATCWQFYVAVAIHPAKTRAVSRIVAPTGSIRAGVGLGGRGGSPGPGMIYTCARARVFQDLNPFEENIYIYIYSILIICTVTLHLLNHRPRSCPGPAESD